MGSLSVAQATKQISKISLPAIKSEFLSLQK